MHTVVRRCRSFDNWSKRHNGSTLLTSDDLFLMFERAACKETHCGIRSSTSG